MKLKLQTSVRLPEQDMRALQAMAEAEGLKLSDMIRRAVRQLLARKEIVQEPHQ